MKKILFVLLCACTLNAVAKPTNEETLLQLVEPGLLLGYQSQASQHSEDVTPERQACIYAIAQSVGTPAIVKQAAEDLKTQGLSKRVGALSQFLSQDSERAAHAKSRDEFDQLLQAHQIKEARAVWVRYLEDTSKRMPKEMSATMMLMFKSLGKVDMDAAMDDNFEAEMHVNPACAALFE